MGIAKIIEPLKKLAPGIWFAGRIFVGLVYAYSGFGKLTEPVENFAGIIAQYGIFPAFAIHPIAAILPWIEFIFGCFLIVGYLPRLSSLVLSLMSLSLVIVLSATEILLKSTPANCGCFGEGGIHLTVRQVFILDCFNFVLGLKLFMVKNHPLSLDRWLTNRTPSAGRR